MTSEYTDHETKLKFKLALLLSAVGDSLGWPQEFTWKKTRDIHDFVKWEKLVGGKYWGYKDIINPGDYSGDTQLTLAVARSIDTSGEFNPEYFAYLELPLWLNYERGGGHSLKTAARNILKKKSQWFNNFYKTSKTTYENAGANGVAMRNLPIALVNYNNEKRFIIDTFKNSIITHGHPRAIIGSILIGGAQIYFFNHHNVSFDDLHNYLSTMVKSSLTTANNNKKVNRWLQYRNSTSAFENQYTNIIKETLYFMTNMKKYFSKDDKEYYTFTKALDRNFKGSGVSTAVCAIYLALKYLEAPEKALFRAVNMVGSDTDTIAGFVGSLIGLHNGNILDSKKIRHLIYNLQDAHYFKDMGNFLWETTNGSQNLIKEKSADKDIALLKIMSWEMGLHEMFWETLEQGDMVVHPTLGKGIIQDKTKKELRRSDYVAKIFKVKFNIGQTAYFHSRVSKEGVVSESMSKEIEKALS